MYQLLEEEGKRKRAIEMLLRVIYIDFSGIDLLKQLEFYKSGFYTVEKMKEYFDVAIMIAPGLIKAIPEYVDVFEDDTLRGMARDLYQPIIDVAKKHNTYVHIDDEMYYDCIGKRMEH